MRSSLAFGLLLLAACVPRGPAPQAAAPVFTPPLPAPTPSPAEKRTPVVTRARITAVGDVLLHDGVQEGADDHRSEINCEGYDHLYQQISQYLADGDLTFANLETPVTEKAPRGHGRWLFNSPIAAVKALKRAGVDVVSVANNHALDQGHFGFVETLSQLDALKLSWVGAATTREGTLEPKVFEVNGITIAIFAFTQFLNEKGNDVAAGAPRVAILDGKARGQRAAEEAVRKAAATYDAVIVSMHWGIEYRHKPRKQEADIAKAFTEAGAMAVLGHHPHVLQPIEVVNTRRGKNAVIFYSMGNFISNQGARYTVDQKRDEQLWGGRRDGALMRFEIVRKDYGGGLATVELGTIDALPLWTENNHLELREAGGPKSETERSDAKRDIHVVAIDRSLANVRRELATIPDPVPAPYVGSWKLLKEREALYLRRKAIISGVLGEQYIRSLESPDLGDRKEATAASP